jgi:hypothetical protein
LLTLHAAAEAPHGAAVTADGQLSQRHVYAGNADLPLVAVLELPDSHLQTHQILPNIQLWGNSLALQMDLMISHVTQSLQQAAST